MMDYLKSGTPELGTVIECRERVEGMEIRVGKGSNIGTNQIMPPV